MKKSLLILSGIILLAGGSGVATAEMTPLTNGQLDLIAAGMITSSLDGTGSKSGVGVDLDADQNIDGDQRLKVENADIYNDVEDIKALNVVTYVGTDVSNISDQSVNLLIMKDDVQKDARAVSINNTIGGKFGSGINVNVGGLERKYSSTGTGAVPSLNQSNIIIQ